jgi:uncharacterized membrane protein YkvA (DUF1232 family)
MGKSPSSDLRETAGFVGGLFTQIRLAWRLYKDGRVSGWVKLIPMAGLLYLLSPVDLLPDLLLPGLGEVDDVVMLLLALKMFVDLSPQSIVREHLRDISGLAKKEPRTSEPYIDVPYRVIDDAKQRKE